MKTQTQIKTLSRTVLFVLAITAFSTSNAWHGGGGWHGGGWHGGGWHGGGWHGGGWHGGGWHGGGWRGYHGGWGGYHRGWGGYYGYGGWGGPGVVIGVPIGGYYAPGCPLVKRCRSNGTCYLVRICN